MRALFAIALVLTSCATPPAPSPPAGLQSWHGPEGEVIEAILADEAAPEVLTFLYDNGTYFVLTDLRPSPQPDAYCYRGLAENSGVVPQRGWQDYDVGGSGLGCSLYRGVVTVWPGDAREWP